MATPGFFFRTATHVEPTMRKRRADEALLLRFSEWIDAVLSSRQARDGREDDQG